MPSATQESVTNRKLIMEITTETQHHNESIPLAQLLQKEEAVVSKTMFQIIISQFKEHKFAKFGLMIIVILALLAIMAPLISKIIGINPNSQDVFNRFKAPMTTISYSSDRQEFYWEKFHLKNPHFSNNLKNELMANPGLRNLNFDFEEKGEDFLISLNEIYNNKKEEWKALNKVKEKNIGAFIKSQNSFKTTHLLGTDELGRDVFMRLIYGSRISLGVGLLVAMASGIIGLFIGSIAGYYGGVLDTILMRITDSLLSLPLLPVLIIFAAIDLNKTPIFKFLIGSEGESVFKLIFILCIFSWMTVARLVRGAILSLKEQEFIHAAKTLGAKNSTIIIKHIVPNVVAPLLVSITINIGQSILSEAALGFLGLGIQPPIPSWGNMLSNAQELIYEAPLLAILPGVLILITVISFNFFGDGLQDAVDPKAIRR